MRSTTLDSYFNEFNAALNRVQNLVEHSDQIGAENPSIASDVRRGALVLVASAIDTLFHKVIVSEAFYRFENNIHKTTNDLRNLNLSPINDKKTAWFEIVSGVSEMGSSLWLKGKLNEYLSQISLYSLKKIDKHWMLCSTIQISETAKKYEKFSFDFLSFLERRRDQIVHESDLDGSELRPLASQDITEQINNARLLPKIIQQNLSDT